MTNRFIPLPSGKYVVMGSGNFAVGGCICSVSGMDGIVYMPLDEPRQVGSDTTDLYPIGSIQAEAAAVIYFQTEAAILQSIEVLQDVLEQHRRRKAPDGTATANFPHGSLGEEVCN